MSCTSESFLARELDPRFRNSDSAKHHIHNGLDCEEEKSNAKKKEKKRKKKERRKANLQTVVFPCPWSFAPFECWVNNSPREIF